MKKQIYFAAGLILGLAQVVSAQTIFSCTTKSGKIATLDREGNNYVYAYGKPHKTEITLKNSVNQVLSNKFTGVVRYAYAANTYVALTNGQYTYVLRSFFSTKNGEEASLYVLKNNKKIANITCSDWDVEFDKDIYQQETNFDLDGDSF